jgi:MoxR-like ATPase
MQHRIVITYEAEAQEVTSPDMVRHILDTVEVP